MSTPEAFSSSFSDAQALIKKLIDALNLRVIGQADLKRRLVLALITREHLLLEGVPGLAKTRSIKALAEALELDFKRVQFTPDLLPADLVGTEVYRPEKGSFEVRKGPVFTNLLLADEINRAPAKVQSALLETMQERQVTIGHETFKLSEPFLVLATQNPIEQEGTYPLPEAQVDRFLMKVIVRYPEAKEEEQMLSLLQHNDEQGKQAVAHVADLDLLHQTWRNIYVDEKIKSYIVDLVRATRTPQEFNLNFQSKIEIGASPRASISLFRAAAADALLTGSTYVTPQHVKNVAPDVLRHRLLLSYEAEAENLTADKIIATILETVKVP
ncbi:AAA family ATPase [bacterium]|nr:AAA family ATPase [bacterium]